MPASPSRSHRWTLSGFLDQLRFMHQDMRDHSFAWVLGAGASKSSGIPLAGELANRWLRELHRRLDTSGQPLADWATEESLGIPNFELEKAASFYSRLYERRFGDNPDEGFAYLEALMSGKDPSPGYSILAQVLDKTRHKVVISTNFDNLVADALSIYTETFPLVIGHESLATFVRVVSRRPVICKIHRDLLLAPKNDHRSLRRLHESWAAALRALFSQYTPVFIGYGGNDDSLMDLLESLDPEDIKGQLIWCYHERFEPSERIVELVHQHAGALVAVPDFDLLMVLIGDQMGLEPIDHAIEERAAKRARQYRERLISLDTTTYPEVRRILRGAFERAGGPLAWYEKIRKEPSTERRRELYEQALEHYGQDLQLQLDYATFLRTHLIDQALATEILRRLQAHDPELQYKPSLELARILTQQGQLDEAAVILHGLPSSSIKSLRLGSLHLARGDTASAEREYRAAFATNPKVLPYLTRPLMGRGRWEDCRALLEQARTEAADCPIDLEWALLQWCGYDDTETASQFFTNIINTSFRDRDPGELILAACFFLANGNHETCVRILDVLASLPSNSWADSVSVAFVRLVQQLLTGSDEARTLTAIRDLLERDYHKSEHAAGTLKKLAESVAPDLPKPYRKFIPALADAIYDPAQRSALNVYTQWRDAGPS